MTFPCLEFKEEIIQTHFIFSCIYNGQTKARSRPISSARRRCRKLRDGIFSFFNWLTDQVVALVESGCDINNKNPSRKRQGANTAFNKAGAPLHYAVRSGHIQIVAYLLSKGADMNILDVEDWTRNPSFSIGSNLIQLCITLATTATLKL